MQFFCITANFVCSDAANFWLVAIKTLGKNRNLKSFNQLDIWGWEGYIFVSHPRRPCLFIGIIVACQVFASL